MPKLTSDDGRSASADLKRLEEIAAWFDAREEVDIEAALEKVKEAAILLKAAKSRLKEIENEFEEVRRDLDGDTEPSTTFANLKGE